MKLKDLFENWGLKGLKVKAGILEIDWQPDDADKNAAWAMYIELLTRITTQKLPDEHGIEATALQSIYKMFEITRDVLKRNGRKCVNFTRIAIIVLNQVIRPFTAKWHKLSEKGAFQNDEQCKAFREELIELQDKLLCYTQLLSELAGVEDLTQLEVEA